MFEAAVPRSVPKAVRAAEGGNHGDGAPVIVREIWHSIHMDQIPCRKDHPARHVRLGGESVALRSSYAEPTVLVVKAMGVTPARSYARCQISSHGTSKTSDACESVGSHAPARISFSSCDGAQPA